MHGLDQHDVFELGLRERPALQQHFDRSTPLAAKEARLPRVTAAHGDVLPHARRSLRSASLLRQRQPFLHCARAALRPTHATGAFCFAFVFLAQLVLQVGVRMLRCKARASAGASRWTLSANMKTVTEALRPCWWLRETDESLPCLE